MKIVIPGGSGQLGTILAREFIAQNHQVIVLSRKPYLAPWPVVLWDAKNLGGWQASFDNADVVINLAGRSVNCCEINNGRATQHTEKVRPPEDASRLR